jgi:two-component system phosphate regulon sensor histidine kinase PhoR
MIRVLSPYVLPAACLPSSFIVTTFCLSFVYSFFAPFFTFLFQPAVATLKDYFLRRAIVLLAVVALFLIGAVLLLYWLEIPWPLAAITALSIAASGLWALVIITNKTYTRLTEALRTIVDTSDAIANGATAARIPLDNTYDGKGRAGDLPEIRRVYQAVNRLADRQANDLQEMQRLARIRSEFFGNVSHEMRTPIFSIQGFLETLLDGALNDEEVRRQFIEKAHSNTMRLNVLLTDLIDISRIESGAMKFSFRYFTITPLLDEIARSLEPAAAANAIRLTVRTENLPYGKETTVYGDRDRLAQVLTNLVDNAIKYNQRGGNVTICAERDRDMKGESNIKIIVQDTGIGIPEEHHSRIFERFYRVDKGRSRAVGGTGLGLAIVKHILEAHKSSIYLESSPNQGTRISFTLKQ